MFFIQKNLRIINNESLELGDRSLLQQNSSNPSNQTTPTVGQAVQEQRKTTEQIQNADGDLITNMTNINDYGKNIEQSGSGLISVPNPTGNAQFPENFSTKNYNFSHTELSGEGNFIQSTSYDNELGNTITVTNRSDNIYNAMIKNPNGNPKFDNININNASQTVYNFETLSNYNISPSVTNTTTIELTTGGFQKESNISKKTDFTGHQGNREGEIERKVYLETSYTPILNQVETQPSNFKKPGISLGYQQQETYEFNHNQGDFSLDREVGFTQKYARLNWELDQNTGNNFSFETGITRATSGLNRKEQGASMISANAKYLISEEQYQQNDWGQFKGNFGFQTPLPGSNRATINGQATVSYSSKNSFDNSKLRLENASLEVEFRLDKNDKFQRVESFIEKPIGDIYNKTSETIEPITEPASKLYGTARDYIDPIESRIDRAQIALEGAERITDNQYVERASGIADRASNTLDMIPDVQTIPSEISPDLGHTSLKLGVNYHGDTPNGSSVSSNIPKNGTNLTVSLVRTF